MSDARRRAARRTELGASGVAAGVGAAFGAAKLRDTYREDPKYGAARLEQHAQRAERIAGPKVGRLIRTGKPGFRPLVVATAAGVTAAGAGRYHDHRVRVDSRSKVQKSVTVSAFGIDHGYELGVPGRRF